MLNNLIEDKNFIIIIGAPRSGTTWLQTILASHPKVASTVELTLYHCYIRPIINRWENEKASINSNKWNLGIPFLYTDEELNSFIKKFLNDVYDRVLSINPTATHIIDKHPGYSFETILIEKYLKKVKFIHVIRDGREVAHSLVRINKEMGPAFGAKNYGTAINTWKSYVKEASKLRGQANYLEIKYETMMQNSNISLKEVFDFLNLESTDELIKDLTNKFSKENMKEKSLSQQEGVKINPSHYGKDDHKDSTFEKFFFNKVAGNLLIELGYEKNTSWWSDGILKDTIAIIEFLKRRLLKEL